MTNDEKRSLISKIHIHTRGFTPGTSRKPRIHNTIRLIHMEPKSNQRSVDYADGLIDGYSGAISDVEEYLYKLMLEETGEEL